MITIGVVQRPCAGETACGDGYTVDRSETGVLIGVVDGLGHGPQAATAADEFVLAVSEDTTLPLAAIMTRAGERLGSTRGAAAALLRLDVAACRVQFSGVGNIHLHAVADSNVHPVCAPGVVGHRVRKLLPFEFDLPDKALFAMCTDGIESRLRLEDYARMEPQAIAEAVLEEHGRAYDDATCVVIRCQKDA